MVENVPTELEHWDTIGVCGLALLEHCIQNAKAVLQQCLADSRLE